MLPEVIRAQEYFDAVKIKFWLNNMTSVDPPPHTHQMTYLLSSDPATTEVHTMWTWIHNSFHADLFCKHPGAPCSLFCLHQSPEELADLYHMTPEGGSALQWGRTAGETITVDRTRKEARPTAHLCVCVFVCRFICDVISFWKNWIGRKTSYWAGFLTHSF